MRQSPLTRGYFAQGGGLSERDEGRQVEVSEQPDAREGWGQQSREYVDKKAWPAGSIPDTLIL